MTGDKLEDILVEKGLPSATADRIDSHGYTSVIREDQSSVTYSPDRIVSDTYLDLRGSDLTRLGIDLDENKACYYDRFGLPKLGYSEDGFETGAIIDERDTAWIVDSVEHTSHYFSTDSNEFIPSYKPEVADPLEFVSKMWEETRRNAMENSEF